MALWFFKKVVWFELACICMIIFLPSNMVAKTIFASILPIVWWVLSDELLMVPRVLINISLKFKCKIHIQKEVILKKITFWSCEQLRTYSLKKMVRVWKTKSLLFCLRYDPIIVSHITFCIKMMLQMACSSCDGRAEAYCSWQILVSNGKGNVWCWTMSNSLS